MSNIAGPPPDTGEERAYGLGFAAGFLEGTRPADVLLRCSHCSRPYWDGAPGAHANFVDSYWLCAGCFDWRRFNEFAISTADRCTYLDSYGAQCQLPRSAWWGRPSCRWHVLDVIRDQLTEEEFDIELELERDLAHRWMSSREAIATALLLNVHRWQSPADWCYVFSSCPQHCLFDDDGEQELRSAYLTARVPLASGAYPRPRCPDGSRAGLDTTDPDFFVVPSVLLGAVVPDPVTVPRPFSRSAEGEVER